MPEIDLGNWESGLDYLTPMRLLAVMLFPNDADRRELFLSDAVAMRSLYEKADPSERDILDRIDPLPDIDGPSPRQRGAIAGEILFVMRTIAERHAGYEASVNKAVYILERRLKDVNDETGERWPTGRRFIRESWTSHKAVSHLWASSRGCPGRC